MPFDPGRPLRVLIVRIGAMGDVLHAMPAVAALRELHPEWFIGWALEPAWGDLLEAPRSTEPGSLFEVRSARRPMVDVWTHVPTREWKRKPFAPATLFDITALRQEMKRDRYDVCVDMQGTIRSAVVGRMAGTKVFAGAAEPWEEPAAWLYRQKVPLQAKHVVEQGCELLGAAVGETLRPAKVSLPVDPKEEKWCDGLLAGVGERFAVIAPTAGWGAKQWPAERYGEVARQLARAGVRT